MREGHGDTKGVFTGGGGEGDVGDGNGMGPTLAAASASAGVLKRTAVWLTLREGAGDSLGLGSGHHWGEKPHKKLPVGLGAPKKHPRLAA